MRRETLWFGGSFAATVSSGVGGTIITSLNAAALNLRPFTIVRTRAEVLVKSDQEIASELQFGAYSECVVSDQAVAIGVTAVPTPVTDSTSDLFHVYQALLNAYEFQTAIGSANVGTRYEVDSKAMRKVEEGQDLIAVVENSAAASAGAGMRVLTFSRTLIKLH